MFVSLKGLNAFVSKTKKQQAQIKRGAANYVRAVAKEVLVTLAENTPQWTGNTAAAWRIDISNAPASFFTYEVFNREPWQTYRNEDKVPGSMLDSVVIIDPYFKGDDPAVNFALKENARALALIKYNSKIRIVNMEPYSSVLATSKEAEYKLRPGNYIEGDVMALRLTEAKFKFRAKNVKLDLNATLRDIT